MNNQINLVVSTFLCVSTSIIGQGTSQAHDDYILKYKDLAISEMKRTSIPASITLGQGILESGGGKSKLATEANNHFGIKAWKGDDWYGATYARKDDDLDEEGNIIYSDFRVYQTAKESYIAHSDFLKNPYKSRYDFLFDLEITDYKAWARGLQEANYAGNSKTYASKLIDLIERYQLHQYDKIATTVVEETVAEIETPMTKEEVSSINNVPCIIVQIGQTIEEVAALNNTSVRHLVNYNDDILNAEQGLVAGQIVFLGTKRWSNEMVGNTYHTVQSGENMVTISQQYGIGIFWLNFKNKMKRGMEPAVGSRIKLNGSRVKNRPLLAEEITTSTEDLTILPLELIAIKPHFNIPTSRSTQPVRIAYLVYTVKAGDTLWAISQQYDLTVEELRQKNGLPGNDISIGQKLRVK